MTNTMPPYAIIKGNNWKEIPVSDAPFIPKETVSIVIPYYNAKQKLDLVLDSISKQDYPKHLTEIIIVDDGSDPPLLKSEVPENIRVVSQIRRGFGAARARNLGAELSTGDILVFVDGDMVLSSNNISAHAKWHHRANNLYVTLGDIRFVKDNVANLDLLSNVHVYNIDYVTKFINHSNQMTIMSNDLFAVPPGPNFSIRRQNYFKIGKQEEIFQYWGIEDTHFLYRAYARGLIIIPITDAYSIHLGIPTNTWIGHYNSAALAEQLIPHRFFRIPNQNRIFKVPEYVVSIKTINSYILLSAVFNALKRTSQDIVVRIDLSNIRSEDHYYITNRLANDPRVVYGKVDSSLSEYPDSPFHIKIDMNQPLVSNYIQLLIKAMGDRAYVKTEWSNHHSRNQWCYAQIIRSWLAHRINDYENYTVHNDLSKTIHINRLISKKSYKITTPVEIAPHKWWIIRVLNHARYKYNTIGLYNTIAWATQRTQHYLRRIKNM